MGDVVYLAIYSATEYIVTTMATKVYCTLANDTVRVGHDGEACKVLQL